ncbi:SPW repeat domain-containing protein [Mycolicibacterium agri]|uniref:SPW repeat-containing protein n=1 Tax=Mycolicibacterium agri TaxID=36811 RepID=A0A7I9W961_MYCAG|nr:SPW repeat protein [Mycolicibacterium agri]GFG54241.1 hypothetical protein MAGR_56820 [Mycolicibacterium agri]
MRSSLSNWVSYLAVAVGIGTVAASLTVTTTPAGRGLTLAAGAFITFFALLSLPVPDRTPLHWGLVVVGLAATILPWLSTGFTADLGAAWTAGVAGALALALGCIGWLNGRPPTLYGFNRYASRDDKPPAVERWISRAALVVGLLTVVIGTTVTNSSPAGAAVAAGLGLFITVIALWSMEAADPTLDYLLMATFGFALFLAPWVVGYAGQPDAVTAWVGGFITTVLGVTGFLRGARRDRSSTVREHARMVYLQRYRHRMA